MKQNSTVKEQSLNPQPNVRPTAQPASTEGLDERVLAALHAASEKKRWSRSFWTCAKSPASPTTS